MGIFTAALSFTLTMLTLLIPIIFSVVILFYVGFSFLGVTFFTCRYFNVYIPFISQEVQYSWMPSGSIGTIIFGGVFLLGFLLSLVVFYFKSTNLKDLTVFFSIIRVFYKRNCYLIFMSTFLSCLSIGALIGNI